MNLLIKNIPNLSIPSQAHPGEDACYDVVATTEPIIVGTKIDRFDGTALWQKVQYIEYGTNLFVCPESERAERIVDIEGFGENSPISLDNFVWLNDPVDYHIHAYPRSSISKYNLSLANSVGTIDTGYRGEIRVRFKYIWQPEDFVFVDEAGGRRAYGIINMDAIYGIGDKICQIEPCKNKPINFLPVENLPTSARIQGGFGSSGK